MGPEYFWWGGMWIFPLVMIVVMLVVVYLVFGRRTRPFCGHSDHGFGGRSSREEPLEILKRRYAQGEITREQFEQIRKDLGG